MKLLHLKRRSLIPRVSWRIPFPKAAEPDWKPLLFCKASMIYYTCDGSDTLIVWNNIKTGERVTQMRLSNVASDGDHSPDHKKIIFKNPSGLFLVDCATASSTQLPIPMHETSVEVFNVALTNAGDLVCFEKQKEDLAEKNCRLLLFSLHDARISLRMSVDLRQPPRKSTTRGHFFVERTNDGFFRAIDMRSGRESFFPGIKRSKYFASLNTHPRLPSDEKSLGPERLMDFAQNMNGQSICRLVELGTGQILDEVFGTAQPGSRYYIGFGKIFFWVDPEKTDGKISALTHVGASCQFLCEINLSPLLELEHECQLNVLAVDSNLDLYVACGDSLYKIQLVLPTEAAQSISSHEIN